MSKRLTAEQVAAQIESEITGRESDWADGHDCASRVAAGMIRKHLIETDEQRRERFERWRRTAWGNISEQDLEWDHDDGMYVSGPVQDQFAAWQAALTWHGETEGGGA